MTALALRSHLPLPLPLPLRLPLPQPRPLFAWPTFRLPDGLSPTMARCLLLALLLHVWLVLLLGNAPGGTALPGEGVFGAINITLRGPDAPGATPIRPQPVLVPSGPAGPAALPRWGGAVRGADRFPART